MLWFIAGLKLIFHDIERQQACCLIVYNGQVGLLQVGADVLSIQIEGGDKNRASFVVSGIASLSLALEKRSLQSRLFQSSSWNANWNSVFHNYG